MHQRNPRCWMDIAIDNQKIGRLEIDLHWEETPITCENFKCLCTGEKGKEPISDKKLKYEGAPFHRIINKFMA